MKFMNVIRLFKNHEGYVAHRNKMLDDAENLLKDEKMDEYKAALEDVKLLDSEYKDFSEAKANGDALRGAVSAKNVLSNDNITGIVSNVGISAEDDKDYRNSFMNYVLSGMPIQSNTAAQTTTSDVGVMIPNTILDRVVEKMETTGTILNKVTRTFYKGGVSVPTSAAKPTATWLTERGSADSQKKSLGSVTFTYHKLKVVIAVSLTADTVTLEIFEKTLANNIAEALVKAMEKAIIAGTGATNNQPEGILTVTPVTGQNVDITEGDNITWDDLCKMESLLPAAYEDAEWLMTKKTYFSQIVAMKDSNGQPIARVNAGIDGKPSYDIIGRPVTFVSSEDMADFTSSVTSDKIVAAMFRMADYMLNTNLEIRLKKYEDEDTDDQMTKAVTIADGKVIDKNSLVTMTIKNS